MSGKLFGYRQLPQTQLAEFPQWLRVLAQQLKDDVQAAECSARRPDGCQLARWRAFLAKSQALPFQEQLMAVNSFANRQEYVLDIDNYGVEDYWAVPGNFWVTGGL